MPSTFAYDLVNPYDPTTCTLGSLALRVRGKMQFMLNSMQPNGEVAEFASELINEMLSAVAAQSDNPPASVETSVVLSAQDFSVTQGKTVQMAAVVYDQFNRPMPSAIVTWSTVSGTQAIVAIDPVTGLLTAVAPGTESIVATSSITGVSALTSVTVLTSAVNHPPTAVIKTPQSPAFTSPVNVAITLDPTGSFDPDGPWNATWTVANAAGTVRFTHTGTMGSLSSNIVQWTPTVSETVTITLVVTDGTLTSTVSTTGTITTVTLVPTSITMPANFGLVVGLTQTVTATVLDQFGHTMTGQTITYSSGTPADATVDTNSGLVTAVLAGSSVITATSGSLTGTVTVTVTAAASGLYVNLPGGFTQPANGVTLMNPPAQGNYFIWQNTVSQQSSASRAPSGVIAPTGAPGGDAIGEVLFPAGFTQVGNAPGIVGSHDLSGNNWTQLYICLIHQFSNNWVNHPSGINKVMFVNSSGGNIGQLVFLNYFNSQWSLARQNTNGDQNQYPVGAVGSVALGFWVRHEFLLIQNTGGLANGTCKYWNTQYDRSGSITSGPTLVANFTNVNWNSVNRVWGNLSWNPVYGGNSSGTLAKTQYQWMNRIMYAGHV